MTKARKMPFGQVERDLSALVSDRVRDAIHSVLQLADSKEAHFVISIQAMTQAVAMCAGAYSAVYGKKLENPFEIAEVVMKLAQEVDKS
jgi:hypothetical protein